MGGLQKLTVNKCNSNDPKAFDIYRLRYDVFAKELFWSDEDINRSEKIFRDSLDDIAEIFLVEDSDEVISSIRFIELSKLTLNKNISTEIYNFLGINLFETRFKKNVALASRFVVKPTRRGSLAAIRLIEHAYIEGLKLDFRFILAYCDPYLIDMYLQLGFRIHRDALVDKDAYFTPLVLVMHDWDYLKKIKSPLHRVALRGGFANKKDSSVDWFYKIFGKEVEKRLAIFDIKKFSQMLLVNTQTPFTKNNPPRVTDGFSEQECQTMLSFSTIIKCNKGFVIIQSGQVTQDMFIVIEGSISVETPYKTNQPFLLGPGQAFGEISMLLHTPRSVNCVVEKDSKLAILSHQTFEKILKVQPALANKLLLNLARTLAFRLHNANNSSEVGSPS
jgi:N-acyl-L-homoserine lactone synthetase